MGVSRMLRVPSRSVFAYNSNLAEEGTEPSGLNGPSGSNIILWIARIEFAVMASMGFLASALDGLLNIVCLEERHWECGILFHLRSIL